MKRLILFIFCFTQLHAQEIDYKGLPEWSWQKEGETEYYLYTPASIQPGMKCPLAIFLHGCCGEDHHATLRNCVDPPARMWHNFAANTQVEPTYIIAPKTTRGWEQKFRDIKTIIDKMVESGQVDKQRIYMTGFSMGGSGTWKFIEQYPDYIAAAIPMGTSEKVDFEKVRNVPVWAIRGELDYFGRNLPVNIAEMRKLNGDPRGSLESVTGVNPMFTDFEGLGHGIQWDAVSHLDLLSWAYSKINDGNVYPVVYFISPLYKQEFQPGDKPLVKIHANDPDGNITHIDLFVNHKLIQSLKQEPYETEISISKGNQLVEAVAYDNGGKHNTAEIIIKTDVDPVFITKILPAGIKGSLYEEKLSASGNDPLTFEMVNEDDLPEGIVMDQTGLIKGIPVTEGDFPLSVEVIDEDGDVTSGHFILSILPKHPDEVIVTDVFSVNDSLINIVSKMKIGELPNARAGTEVSFSKIGKYEGLTFISTSAEAANFTGDSVLTFTVDENVKVYVVYEKLDLLFTSTIPGWLSTFSKEPGAQIEAQYHYYDVYSKSFPEGKIYLPGADAKANNVLTNYFVMISKEEQGNNVSRKSNESINSSFHPGEIWYDKDSVSINAHGGGILYYEGICYWFGEHKIEGEAGNMAHVGVHCYSSQDLYNWKNEGIALHVVGDDPDHDIARGCILEKPKVINNAKTGKFVMWFHLELKSQGYKAARSGVAVADHATVPYTCLEVSVPTSQPGL